MAKKKKSFKMHHDERPTLHEPMLEYRYYDHFLDAQIHHKDSTDKP